MKREILERGERWMQRKTKDTKFRKTKNLKKKAEKRDTKREI
jgi:hypothetical protein